MIDVDVNSNYKVTLYESGDEMPMDLYFLSQQYALLDAEAGSTIQDVLKRFDRMDAFHRGGKMDELIQERKNLHATFFNIINDIHFPSLIFGCHIQGINGKPLDDHSTDRLIKIMKDMGRQGFKYKSLMEAVEDVKKKIEHELALMFPEKYDIKNSKLNYLQQLQRKIIAEANYVLTEDNKFITELESIMAYFLSLMKPKNINGSDPTNVIVQSKKAYEKICALLALSGIPSPGNLPIIKFHVAVDTYESKRKPKP